MALDLYVGSLTRYYSGDWENMGQQWARENGVPYEVVRPGEGGEDGDVKIDKASIRAAIYDWREVLTEGLAEELEQPLDWQEDPAAPYFTARPHWDGYGALMLLAALEENGHHSPPDIITEEWSKHPAYLESKASLDSREDPDQITEYLQIITPELWLPTDFAFTFQFTDLTGHQLTIGSAPRLLDQLELLNERTYRGDHDARDDWRSKAPKKKGPFAYAARYGLSIFIDLVEAAVDNDLPIKLDY